MKLKQIEQFLQQVDDFEEPKIKYEQYATNAHLAGNNRIYKDDVFLSAHSPHDLHGREYVW